MAWGAAFLDCVLDQLAIVHGGGSCKLFGAHATYHSSKVVALLCGNQHFMMPTMREAIDIAFAGAVAQVRHRLTSGL